jgi:hypothetical protein
MLRALITNFGRGRGKCQQHQREYTEPKNIYRTITTTQLKKKTRLTQKQYHDLITSLQEKCSEIVAKSRVKCVPLEERFLIIMCWIVKYPDYDTLLSYFGLSEFMISVIIHEMMPHLVEYFIQFIPHRQISEKHNKVSSKIIFIIDGTVHKRKKPKLGQHHYYWGDKGCHFITTQLLIDFDGWIVALATAIPGHMHDVNSARNLPFFREIIGSLYALADPGYDGCDYVISGMKRKCIHTDNEREFFKITYREQRKIEHINNFFKKC